MRNWYLLCVSYSGGCYVQTCSKCCTEDKCNNFILQGENESGAAGVVASVALLLAMATAAITAWAPMQTPAVPQSPQFSRSIVVIKPEINSRRLRLSNANSFRSVVPSILLFVRKKSSVRATAQDLDTFESKIGKSIAPLNCAPHWAPWCENVGYGHVVCAWYNRHLLWHFCCCEPMCLMNAFSCVCMPQITFPLYVSFHQSHWTPWYPRCRLWTCWLVNPKSALN